MVASTRKFASVALAAVGLSAGLAGAAKANTVLPVTNLEFNQLTNNFQSGNDQKDFFKQVQPLGWSVGNGGDLIYVGKQGSEGFQGSVGNVYKVYDNNPGYTNTVPAGTNFFQADGNPIYASTIYQTITGLVAGETYDLQFQQASGQQVGFNGATTEQWKVFLGVGGIGTNCSTPPTCSITGTAGNIEHDSPIMNTPEHGNINWNNVTMSFTPTAAELTGGTAILTFLAWGNNGDTANEPPTVFLEGVNTPPVDTPEPATLTLLGVGVLGVAGLVKRQRGKRNVAG